MSFEFPICNADVVHHSFPEAMCWKQQAHTPSFPTSLVVPDGVDRGAFRVSMDWCRRVGVPVPEGDQRLGPRELLALA